MFRIFIMILIKHIPKDCINSSTTEWKIKQNKIEILKAYFRHSDEESITWNLTYWNLWLCKEKKMSIYRRPSSGNQSNMMRGGNIPEISPKLTKDLANVTEQPRQSPRLTRERAIRKPSQGSVYPPSILKLGVPNNMKGSRMVRSSPTPSHSIRTDSETLVFFTYYYC